jgi:hypothetical protein
MLLRMQQQLAARSSTKVTSAAFVVWHVLQRTLVTGRQQCQACACCSVMQLSENVAAW